MVLTISESSDSSFCKKSDKRGPELAFRTNEGWNEETYLKLKFKRKFSEFFLRDQQKMRVFQLYFEIGDLDHYVFLDDSQHCGLEKNRRGHKVLCFVIGSAFHGESQNGIWTKE